MKLEELLMQTIPTLQGRPHFQHIEELHLFLHRERLTEKT
jgi:hypothetical protein